MNPLLLFIAAAVFTILAVLIVALIYRQKNLQLIEIKNRELQAEALRADQASEAKSQFLSSMSHDMRTPLNGVISFTDFALKADSKEKKQEYIEKTRRSAKILMSLINDTLEVSRIESGEDGTASGMDGLQGTHQRHFPRHRKLCRGEKHFLHGI